MDKKGTFRRIICIFCIFGILYGTKCLVLGVGADIVLAVLDILTIALDSALIMMIIKIIRLLRKKVKNY